MVHPAVPAPAGPHYQDRGHWEQNRRGPASGLRRHASGSGGPQLSFYSGPNISHARSSLGPVMQPPQETAILELAAGLRALGTVTIPAMPGAHTLWDRWDTSRLGLRLLVAALGPRFPRPVSVQALWMWKKMSTCRAARRPRVHPDLLGGSGGVAARHIAPPKARAGTIRLAPRGLI